MNFDKRPIKIISLGAAIMLLSWHLDTNAQVTFSKDWGPGKRNLEESECHVALKSASAVCHILLNQIRQLSRREYKGEDEGTGIFSV